MAEVEKIKFKNYCWAVGTTSFRMKNFNYNIEQQLIYLEEFFNNSDYSEIDWEGNNGLQREYYYFLQKKGFVKGNAPKPDKDARQKTSGLVDLGLITAQRRLTEVGKKLVSIAKNADFKDNNFFGIDKDSYVYLNQLLKYTTDGNVRPFVVFLNAIIKLGYISEEEFKYLLPLATSKEKANEVVTDILAFRNHKKSLDDTIIELIQGMDNYKSAEQYFLENEPSEQLFQIINMNRKSPIYEKPYYKFYLDFLDVYKNRKADKIVALFDDVRSINGGSEYWKKLLFKTSVRSVFVKNPVRFINDLPINQETEEDQIKKYFFYKTHLFKWKANLDDYFDLNRRYFKTTDIVIFKAEKIQLTTTAKHFFEDCIEQFFENSFCEDKNFEGVTTLKEVLGDYYPNTDKIYEKLGQLYGEAYLNPESLNRKLQEEKLVRFNKLIDDKFGNDVLISLLGIFEDRRDEELCEVINSEADAPTLFEYVLGICWYKISERKGDILEFLNLSLDSELLPKQHAGGGEADIVYKYEKTESYPRHNLLLEATLADSTTQRRMEMEPVSRHLMRDLEETDNTRDYAVLATTYVHPSVVSDFRGRAFTEQTLDDVHYFDGLKILPIETGVIKAMLRKNMTYSQIYPILDEAFRSTVSIREGWYAKNIVDRF